MPSVRSRHVAAVCESFERRTLLSVSVAGEPWEAIRKSDFSDVSDMTLNGSATNEGTGGRLRLTDAVEGEAGSAFFDTPRSVRFWDLPVPNGFSAEFTFEVSEGGAEPGEGFFFVLHDDPRGAEALGEGGRGMGWAGLEKSVGVKFDAGADGGAQTGVYLNGEAVSDDPTDQRNRVLPENLRPAPGRVLRVRLSYDAHAGGLWQLIDDVRNPATPVFATSYSVDVRAVVGDEANVGFTGATGVDEGRAARQEVLSLSYHLWHADVFGGRVTQVFVNGPMLTEGRVAFRVTARVELPFGYPVPAGAAQTRPLPWPGGITSVSLRFDSPAPIDQGDLLVRGTGGEIPTTGFTYDPATRTATWTLATPVMRDKLRLFLDDAAVPGLDGEWTNPTESFPRTGGDAYPSGDLAPGGDFDFRVNVLQGDVSGDGVVNALDVAEVKRRLARRPGDGVYDPRTEYTIFSDVSGDGVINAPDLAIVKARLTQRIDTMPAPASAAAPAPVPGAVGVLRSATEDVLVSGAPGAPS